MPKIPSPTTFACRARSAAAWLAVWVLLAQAAIAGFHHHAVIEAGPAALSALSAPAPGDDGLPDTDAECQVCQALHLAGAFKPPVLAGLAAPSASAGMALCGLALPPPSSRPAHGGPLPRAPPVTA